MSTPSVLGFDRQLTAPIAFPLYRKVHAVLLVDMHRVPDDTEKYRDTYHTRQRDAVASFQRACREERRTWNGLERDLVCVIIPSTETRVLATFGIDIWTPFDAQVTALTNAGGFGPASKYNFPSMMVTDARYGGTRRYYLEQDLDQGTIATFLADFWAGELKPDRRSDGRGPRTNKAGVRILTADSLPTELLAESASGQHALMAFTSPTCGHCKRFKVLYNQLGELIGHLDWNGVVGLYEMDVTKNDLLDVNATVRWIPDLYYLPPSRTSMLAYNDTAGQGDGVGALNDFFGILDWFFDQSSLPSSDIQSLLAGIK
jgi:hypothetical protein